MKFIELIESGMPIQFGSTSIDTTTSRLGYTPVLTDVKAFDNAWQASDMYIGPNGAGGIKNRYEQFGLFVNGGTDTIGQHTFTVAPATSIELSDVNVTANGEVAFVNGRHRYAWFRDQGVNSIPVAMDSKSIEHAKHFNLI
jgi:hypothetical protein